MKITDITQNEWSNYVGLLTENQKNQLVGQEYTTDTIFNPIEDNNSNWVISTIEVTNCDNQEFMWVQNLEIIPFVPKPRPVPTPQNI
jgi:hypothetical protein